jgi:hypothetical protein
MHYINSWQCDMNHCVVRVSIWSTAKDKRTKIHIEIRALVLAASLRIQWHCRRAPGMEASRNGEGAAPPPSGGLLSPSFRRSRSSVACVRPVWSEWGQETDAVHRSSSCGAVRSSPCTHTHTDKAHVVRAPCRSIFYSSHASPLTATVDPKQIDFRHVQFRYAIQIINFWYRRKIFQNRKNVPLAAQLPSVITRGTQSCLYTRWPPVSLPN